MSCKNAGGFKGLVTCVTMERSSGYVDCFVSLQRARKLKAFLAYITLEFFLIFMNSLVRS